MTPAMKRIGDITPAPQQGDLFEVDASWFHVFRDFVASGQMAAMTSSSVKVYLVIRAYTNPSTGDSFPSVDTIMEKSGLSRASVMRELKTLEDQGHIRRAKSGRHNVYNLLDKWPIKSVTTGEVVRRVEVVPYIPRMVEAITRKLKQALLSGDLPRSGPININMPVTINYAADGGTIINNSAPEQPHNESFVIDATVVEESLEKLPDEMREALLRIRPVREDEGGSL